MGKIQVLGNQQTQACNTRETLAEESAQYGKKKERLAGRIEQLEAEIESELASLRAKLDGYRTEMASPLANGLSPLVL